MADVWFRKLGFGRNPFNIRPAAFSFELYGINTDAVLSGIEDGKVMFVEAPLGYGKTTLLRGIVHRFGGRRKVVYAHTLQSERIDVKDLLKRSSVANYIAGNLPKGMILVIDEAQNITPDNSAEVMEFYKSGNVRAVVFFGTKYCNENFVEALNTAMNGNIMRLSKPTPEQAILLVRSRVGNLPLLSNAAILSAYYKANGNPRRILQVCEDLCRDAFEHGKLSVSEELSVTTPAAAAIATTAAAGAGKLGKVEGKRAKRRPKGNKRLSQPKPSKPSRPLAAVKSTASTRQQTESTEGSYWGEFMGMQK